uniref:Uncharacterized protein n=1 Tax=Grapevine-associated levi-like virus 6 TaxID=2814361 RepID=A0A8F7KK28_9VIRU|nr:MAG: hypothetical protein [Grapevine-associated levi-like virus 6]
MSSAKLGTNFSWVDDSRPLYDSYFEPDQDWTVSFLSQNGPRVNGHYRDSHLFICDKQKISRSISPMTVYRRGFGLAYRGGIPAAVPGEPPLPEIFSLEDWGAEAIARSKPDKPSYPIANALYELKDVPSMIRDIPVYYQRGYRSLLRTYGNSYLATDFAWLPFMQDLSGFAHAHHNAIEKLDRLTKTSSRVVHSRITLKDEKTATDVVESQTYGFDRVPFVEQCWAGEPSESTHFETSTKIWFSGQYSYRLPEPGPSGSSRWSGKTLRRMEGLNVTAYTLYKAIPWTWLIDWFGDFGDIVSNYSQDALDWSLNYGTIQGHFESYAVHRARRPVFTSPDGSSTGILSAETRNGYDAKRRVVAYPNFGRLKTENLTGFQLGVLSAFAAKYVGRGG